MDNKKTFIQRKQHHKKLVDRIKKHSTMIDITLLAVAITIFSLALSHIIPMSATAKENIQKYEFLKKMIEMDDIAHEQREEIKSLLGSGYNMQRDRLFQIVDNQYHIAQGRDEKFKAATRLHELMIQEDTLLQQIGKGNVDQMEKCNQLQEEGNQLQKRIIQTQ